MAQLEKAQLIPVDGATQINFMFNPTQLSLSESVQTSENPGARTQDQGNPKVSFSYTTSRKITISNIPFDTYETGKNVRDLLVPFLDAVRFAPGQERPSLYAFVWGGQLYLRRCFVEQVQYKLTMFLANGTPVRAMIETLSLKEADEPKPNASLSLQDMIINARLEDSPANRQAEAKGKSNSPRGQQTPFALPSTSSS